MLKRIKLFINAYIIRKKLKIIHNIGLIVYDFDGVMTDNRVVTTQDGLEAVVVNRADGLAIDWLKKMNIRQIIISTESNPVVLTRAKKIGLSAIVNTYNKQKALVDYCQECYIDMKKVIYVGNDINDLDAMNVCGMVVVPSDAHPSVKKVADVVLNTPGGGGVIRELMDLIIASIYSN